MTGALPTSCPCVDIFHLDLRDRVEKRVRRKCLMNRVDLAQLCGHVPNLKYPYTAVRRRGCKTRHARQNRLAIVSDRTTWRARLKSLGDPPLWRWSCRTRNQSLLAYVLDSDVWKLWRVQTHVSLPGPMNFLLVVTWSYQNYARVRRFERFLLLRSVLSREVSS